MTATLIERVPLGRITTRARAAHPGRVLLTVIAALLFGAGWVAFKVFAAAWFAFAWCAVAVHEGWHEARGPKRTGVSSG